MSNGVQKKAPRPEMFPVMLTPFTEENEIDYPALEALIAFYEENGADGLFAVCQSSEMFFLSLKERVQLAAFVKKHAHVPVVASGHISSSPSDQIDELRRIANTGVDGVILITNRFADPGEGDEIWKKRLEKVLNALDPDIPLGFYECPLPYKRLLTLSQLAFAAQSGRFRFMKDTCCDIETIRARLRVLEGTGMGLYNANTATLLDSLIAGAAGFSGIMANFHPELYRWLLANWRLQPEKAKDVQSLMTVCSHIESHLYPVCAKYHLSALKGLPITTFCRTKDRSALSPLIMDTVKQMDRIVSLFEEKNGIPCGS